MNIFLLILSDKCGRHGNGRSSISGAACLINTFPGFPFLLELGRMFVLSPGAGNCHPDTTQGHTPPKGGGDRGSLWRKQTQSLPQWSWGGAGGVCSPFGVLSPGERLSTAKVWAQFLSTSNFGGFGALHSQGLDSVPVHTEFWWVWSFPPEGWCLISEKSLLIPAVHLHLSWEPSKAGQFTHQL